MVFLLTVLESGVGFTYGSPTVSKKTSIVGKKDPIPNKNWGK